MGLRRFQSTLAAAVITLATGQAAAEPCGSVVADRDLSSRWQTAASSLEHGLASSGVDCGGALVRLQRDADAVRVTVTTSDGRRAARTVAYPGELGAVVAGVVASVPFDPPPAVALPVPSDAPATSQAPSDFVLPAPTAPSPSTDPATSPATLGATFGTRVGLPTGVVSTELELRGDFRFDRWVFSLSGEVAPTGTRVARGAGGDLEYTEVGLGTLVGRWFYVGDGFLTLTAGPRVGLVTRENDEVSRSRSDLWIEVAARWVAPVGDRLRPAISLEGEGAPSRLFVLNDPRLAAFPSWGAAFSAGVVGSVP